MVRFTFILIVICILFGKSTVGFAEQSNSATNGIAFETQTNSNAANLVPVDGSRLQNASTGVNELWFVLAVVLLLAVALGFLFYQYMRKTTKYNVQLEAQVNELSKDLHKNIEALSLQVLSLQVQKKTETECLLPEEEAKPQLNHAVGTYEIGEHEYDDEQAILITADPSQVILLVDDDSVMLDFMKSVFERYFTVLTASNGKDGLLLAQTELPSLIVTDINMPLLSGFSLCQQLKNDENTCHIPIILLTSESSYQSEGFACGADDFIEKPFKNQNILLKVHAFLENRRKLRAQLLHKNESVGFIMPESFNDVMLQKIFSYVNIHFSNSNIDINEVAEHVGLSRSQLWRKFKAATGQNMSDYVLELRLLKAKEMLRTGKYKVAEVAYDVGFTNSQYFSRSFSARFGESPKDCIDAAKAKNETASI